MKEGEEREREREKERGVGWGRLGSLRIDLLPVRINKNPLMAHTKAGRQRLY